MIKINLLGDETVIDHSNRYVALAYLCSIAVALLVFFGMYTSVGSSIADLTEQRDLLEKEIARLQRITKEVQDLEKKKDEYHSKLLVIATLKKSKAGPVRVMDDLNVALPEKAWLSEVKENTGVFSIIGRALDDQTIASFMRDLEKSDYFDKVDPVEIKLMDMEGVKVKEFSVQAAISYTGTVEPSADATGAAAPAGGNSADAARGSADGAAGANTTGGNGATTKGADASMFAPIEQLHAVASALPRPALPTKERL